MSTRTQPFPFVDFERARASVESALTKDDDLYMMLVGETGVGKTALLRQLHRTLDRCRFRVIYFAHARRLTAPGLIRVLSGQFRLHPKRSHPETVLDLSRHMAEEPAQLLLWFDEAHALPEDTFDEARTFAESDLDGSRPVRLLLSGLPELRERLMASPALWRRVTLREEITGITADEVPDFFVHHLGATVVKRIARDGLMAVFERGRGAPGQMLPMMRAVLRAAPGKGKIDIDWVDDVLARWDMP